MYKIKIYKGITLIALIITIVILLVLAVVALGAVTGEDGIIKRAQETKFLSDVGKYKEELELYKTNWELEYQLSGRKKTDGIDNPSQINERERNKIRKYIPSFEKKYENKLYISKGELAYWYTTNETEMEWAKKLGLEIRIRRCNNKNRNTWFRNNNK